MFKYYDFVKGKYNINPKIDFTDEIIDGVKVYIHKATCEYNDKHFKSEILTETEFNGTTPFVYMSILLTLQLNNKINDYLEKSRVNINNAKNTESRIV